MQGWKTAAVAVGVAAFGAAEQLDWVNLVGEANAGFVVAAIGGLMLLLRAVTKSPLGKKAA